MATSKDNDAALEAAAAETAAAEPAADETAAAEPAPESEGTYKLADDPDENGLTPEQAATLKSVPVSATAVDAAGVERIVIPTVTDFVSAPMESTKEEIAAHETSRKRIEDMAAARRVDQ